MNLCGSKNTKGQSPSDPRVSDYISTDVNLQMTTDSAHIFLLLMAPGVQGKKSVFSKRPSKDKVDKHDKQNSELYKDFKDRDPSKTVDTEGKSTSTVHPLLLFLSFFSISHCHNLSMLLIISLDNCNVTLSKANSADFTEYEGKKQASLFYFYFD